MAAAKESELGDLHNKVAKVMGSALDTISKQQIVYEQAITRAIENEDPELMPASEPNVNPALLSVITRFLDSNKITCVPEAGNTMGELERKLKEKKERKLRVVGGISHTDEE